MLLNYLNPQLTIIGSTEYAGRVAQSSMFEVVAIAPTPVSLLMLQGELEPPIRGFQVSRSYLATDLRIMSVEDSSLSLSVSLKLLQ